MKQELGIERPQEMQLFTGQIREAIPSDAKKLNAYIRKTYESAEHLITRPEEFRIGPWKQRFWIARKSAAPDQICLLAIENEEIVGMLDNWLDRRLRVRHVTTFAMSVAPADQQKGIGTALLKTFINWCQNHKTIQKIELHVHSDNTHAYKLYEKLGFEREGQRQGSIQYDDGRIVDDILMALWPKETNNVREG